MICLIDGDILMYRCAWSNDKSDDFQDVKDHVVTLMYEILSNNNSKDYISYLTGRNNFRYDIPESKDYKGTRKSEKPKWFLETKDFMINELGYHLTDRIEADDALIISSKRHPNSVICTTDKDLLQYPGTFYNINHKTITVLTKEEGLRNFWKQMLTGDVSDNVKGVEGIGPKIADKILNSVDQSHYMYRVMSAYVSKYGEYEGVRFFYENYRMLKLLDNHENFVEPEIRHMDYSIPIENYAGKRSVT